MLNMFSNLAISVLLILFSFGLIHAEIAKRFLVKRQGLSGELLDKYNVVKGRGKKNSKQPILSTSELLPSNTDYYILNISSETAEESSDIEELRSFDCLIPISETEVYNEYNAQVGGMVTRVVTTEYGVDPGDVEKDWSVKESTPR